MRTLFWILLSTASVLQAAVFSLPVASGDPAGYYFSVTNTAGTTASFTMTINGGLSRTTADLAAQMSALPEAYAGEPAYRKAWRYVASNRYHSSPITSKSWQHDPSFYLNSIGLGLCDDAATSLATVWSAMGYPVRVWGLSGHVVSELFVGGRWQMFDADGGVYYHRNAAHDVAGVDDLAADPALVSNAIDPIAPAGLWAYTYGVGMMYATTNNNSDATASYLSGHYEKELIFQIPAGSALHVGAVFSSKRLATIVSGEYAPSFAHARLIIPAGFRGTIDMPLALHDIQGSPADSVSIDGTSYAVGSAALEAFIERRTNSASVNDQPKAITMNGSSGEIAIIYLINKRFAAPVQNNTVVVNGTDAASIRVSLTPIVQTQRWMHWSADEAAGSDVFDSGPFALHGRLIGAAFRTNGVRGRAMSLSGGGYLDLAPAMADPIWSGSFSVSAWVRPSRQARMPLFGSTLFEMETTSSLRVQAYYRTNAVFPGNALILSSSSLATNRWQHVAYSCLVSNGMAAVVLYIDGVSNAGMSAPMMSDTYYRVGPFAGFSSWTGLSWSGDIDEVRIDGGLTAAHAAQRFIADTNAPQVTLSGPREIRTSAVLTLTTDKHTGWWSTNRTAWASFSDSAVVAVDRPTTIWYYGVNVFGHASRTNREDITAAVTPSVRDLSAVFVRNNPYIGGGSIVFENVTPTASVRIYTLSGKLVRTLFSPRSGNSGSLIWDIGSDGRAAPGVYLCRIADDGSSGRTIKVMVKR